MGFCECRCVASDECFRRVRGNLERTPNSRRRKDEQEIVLSSLRDVLGERNGRWLLCIDGVDDASERGVRGILEEVSSIAESKKGGSWVVVTFRCEHSVLWNNMQKKQNIIFEFFLSVEDAMYVLWRYEESIRTTSTPDGVVADAVSRFKQVNEEEYDALRELCGFRLQCVASQDFPWLFSRQEHTFNKLSSRFPRICNSTEKR